MSSLLRSTLNTRALPTGNLRYIRSDYPGKLTDEEVRWLKENNIMTVVDLREEKEYTARVCRLENEEGFLYYHMPVTGGGDTPESVEAVAVTYLGMLDEMMDEIIDTIMNAKSNVLFFCGAGKDRTGVVSAIILKKLGYGDETIIKDYMETKDNLMGFLTAYVKEHPEVDLSIIIPNEENIKKVLNVLDEKLPRLVGYDDKMKEKVFEFTDSCFKKIGKTFEPDKRHSFYNNIEEEFDRFWCLVLNKEVLGTVGVKHMDDDTAELKALYLSDRLRGKGYGRLLLDTAVGFSKDKGYKRIVLDSMEKYTDALRLYEKYGFKHIERYNENMYADVFMEYSFKDLVNIK
ncbi:MAG: GNAT family N-acetyltransferase [Lachnospiraceae bacterium]|nr:GNAT family N-acetyltransferase [Lachnospiraceae bacterium]